MGYTWIEGRQGVSYHVARACAQYYYRLEKREAEVESLAQELCASHGDGYVGSDAYTVMYNRYKAAQAAVANW